ncbi:hypothetical protein K438DRAFT_1964838 [Mycena galopus ATCC 62051]|nr:hypothetical protein K438DRAFT_1964838 [Mycena galopus ATCC 62051]
MSLVGHSPSPTSSKPSPESMGNNYKSVSKQVLAQGIAKYAAEAHRPLFLLRNQDKLREKARIRMAVHRQRLKECNSDWEIQKERARASDKKYRRKHAENLAQKQRVRRKNAYIEKYGVEAHIERGAQEENAWREKAAAIAQEVAAEAKTHSLVLVGQPFNML